MKPRYLTQPLLSSPSKWVAAQKWHRSDLYVANYYDSTSLQHNPFAQSLISTKSDGTMVRFPRGNMIELIADAVPQTYVPPAGKNSLNKLAKYWIIPLLHTLDKAQYYYTSHHIINNEKYINFVLKEGRGLQFRFYPRKLAYKQGEVPKHLIEMMPNFDQIVQATFQRNVLKGLEAFVPEKSSSNQQGLVLTTSGTLFRFAQTPIVNISLILPQYKLQKDMFIPYEGNTGLCQNIIDLVNFKS